MDPDLERDGFVIRRGVVPAGEVAELEQLFVSIIPELVYPRGDDGIVREVTGLARQYAPLQAIARDPRFGALAAEALGASRVQLLQDSLLYKPALDGGSVALHQDRTYIGYLVPARVATLRLALRDETIANGCMHAVAGSHRWGSIGDDRSLVADNVASLEAQLSAEQRAQRPAPLELRAGDVSIHHCLTLHGSGPNASDGPRRTIILRMFDSVCRLDAAKLPPHAAAYFPTDADGHLSTEAFPVVHGNHSQPAPVRGPG